MTAGTPYVPSTPTSSKRAMVTRVQPTHASAVAAFLRQVWDPEATAEVVLQNLREGGDGAPPTFICLRDDRVIGYVTTLPFRLWCGGSENDAHWIKGLMVLPEYRNGPVGHALAKEAALRLPLALSIAVAPSARRLFTSLGFIDVGVVPNQVRVVRPRSFLRKLDLTALEIGPRWLPAVYGAFQRVGLVPLASAAVSVVDTVHQAFRMRGRGLTVTLSDTLHGVDVDRLWAVAQRGLPLCAVRDANAWRSRYELSVQAGRYRFVVVKESAMLRALAVVRTPSDAGDGRLKGIRVATLADALWVPADVVGGSAALRGVDAAALAMGADAILCSATLPSIRKALRRHLFIPVGGNLHLLVHPRGLPVSPGALTDWHVMRGDAQADDVF